jgi:sugar/nucleoside kinase (ribokinase family)
MTYDLVVIGNIAFDVNSFPRGHEAKCQVVINLGGAGFYSLLPASLFSRNVGLVARVGSDFPINRILALDIDTTGLKTIPNAITTRFHHTYLSEDGQERTFEPHVSPDTLIRPADVPPQYFDSRFVHVATNFPETQIAFIEVLRRRSSATISIDTHEAYLASDRKNVGRAFDMVDIAFIDQKEHALIAESKAPLKVIKRGKHGMSYLSGGSRVDVHAVPCDVVDKTGAGDVLAGVFLVLRARGLEVRPAAEKAIEVATESVKDYGVEFLVRSYPNCRLE